MTDLLTTCDNNVDAVSSEEHYNHYNEQNSDDIEERNKLAYMIEATENLKRFLGSTLKTTDNEIEMELEEMQEALRTTGYWTYKTYREGLDDEKRNGKTPCLEFA